MIYRIGTETLALYENGSCSLCGGAPVPFVHLVLEGKIIPAEAAEPAEGGFTLHFGDFPRELRYSSRGGTAASGH